MDPFEQYVNEHVDTWQLDASDHDIEEMNNMEVLFEIVRELPDEILMENLTAADSFLLQMISRLPPKDEGDFLNWQQRAILTAIVILRDLFEGEEPEGVIG